MVNRLTQSIALVDLDCRDAGLGFAPNECGALGSLHSELFQMESSMNEAFLITTVAIIFLCFVVLAIIAMNVHDASEYRRIMRERDWESK